MPTKDKETSTVETPVESSQTRLEEFARKNELTQLESTVERLTKVVEKICITQTTAVYEDVRRDGELENLCLAMGGLSRTINTFMETANKKYFPDAATWGNNLSTGMSNTGRALVEMKSIVEAQQKQIELLTQLVTTRKAIAHE